MSRRYLDETGLAYFWSKLKDLFNGKVDKVSGKGLSTNDYTTTEKNKLAGIAEGATKVTVDASLSSTSTNAIQNKAVKTALDGKLGTGDLSSDYHSSATNKALTLTGAKNINERQAFRTYAVSASSPYFTRYDGAGYSIGTITSDISAAFASNNWGVLYEYFRETVFDIAAYGGGGSTIITDNGKPIAVSALFIRENGNSSDWMSSNLKSFFLQSGLSFTDIDSFKVEALGGKHSNAECTLKISVYTILGKTYTLQICATHSMNPTYTTSGWVCLEDSKVDKVSGKGLSTNDYTTTEKNKLAGIETGANKTTVDTALSSTSTNPVQNKVINTALGNKVDKVSGKGLSTNDYTTTEKNKLGSLPTSDELQTEFAKYAKKTDIAAAYIAKGSSSSIPTLSSQTVGWVYNITSQFTTTSDFVEGAGKVYPAGTNIVCIEVSSAKKWDVLSGLVDLSPYELSSNLVAITNSEIDAILAG